MPGLVSGIHVFKSLMAEGVDGRDKPGHDNSETDCRHLVFSNIEPQIQGACAMIRKLASGKYRLYSRKKNPKTGRRRNLGTFGSRAAAQKHERAVQFFKRG
jgi:hypothetical protein